MVSDTVTDTAKIQKVNLTLEPVFLKGQGFSAASLFPYHDANLPRLVIWKSVTWRSQVLLTLLFGPVKERTSSFFLVSHMQAEELSSCLLLSFPLECISSFKIEVMMEISFKIGDFSLQLSSTGCSYNIYIQDSGNIAYSYI